MPSTILELTKKKPVKVEYEKKLGKRKVDVKEIGDNIYFFAPISHMMRYWDDESARIGQGTHL